MQRVLIIGSKGMAGHIIRQYFIEQGVFNIKDIARDSDTFKPDYLMDVSDLDTLEIVINEFSPNYIINCIGVLNKDAEEHPDTAIFFNGYFPHFLAQKSNAKLIHISTDCVFSGKKGDYTTDDEKDGKGFYASSKAIGEVVYGNHLTIRTSIVGPEIKSNGIGLLNWFLRNSESSVKGYTSAYWTGVTTLQLAKSIHQILMNQPSLNGLIHLTNNKKITKLDLLHFFKDVFGSPVEIVPYSNYRVDKSLISSNQFHILAVPDYHAMILELKKWMQEHKELYKYQYN